MANEFTLGETAGALKTYTDLQLKWNDRMDAKLDAIDTKLDRFNGRVGHLEQKAAVSGSVGGAISGSLVSLAVGIALYWLTKGQ
jgi:hypothetical protein